VKPKSEEFRLSVRAHLQRVPLDIRRSWDQNSLFGWWLELSSKDPNVTSGRAAGELWLQVKESCMDLIGPHAK
jgi:hypothetical protein